MTNKFLLNRSGMSPEVTCRKGRHAIESIVSRFSLASLFCLCMLTFGVGNVWGTDEVAHSLSFPDENSSSNSCTNYTGTWTATNDETSAKSWTIYGFVNNSWNDSWAKIRAGAKKSKAKDAAKSDVSTITTSAAFSEAITQVVVTTTMCQATADRYLSATKLTLASDASFTQNVVEYNGPTTATDNTMTFTVSSPTAARYYKLSFSWYNNTTTAGVIEISQIDYYQEASCAAPTAPSNSSNTSSSLTLATTSTSASYDFYCSTTNSTSGATALTIQSVTGGQSKTYTGLNYGTTYYYWIRKDCGGGSTSSWVAGASTATTAAPNTGLSISAGSLKPTKATFTIGDSNSPKINTYGGTYDIYYSTSDDTPTGSTVASRNESTLSWTATGLTAGTKYYYWVRGHGANANSSWVSGGNFTTPTLSSITVKTEPTTTTYFAGQTFSPTGLVITANYSNSSSEDFDYATYSASFSFSPTTATALTTSDAAVTITYGGKTVDQALNVYSVTVNKVDEDGATVSADGVTASWTVGTKALAASATAGSKYVFKEWAFDGSNNGLSITSTSSANTTVTGTPIGNVTIKAVFYKPRVVKWSVNGNDSYNTGGPTSTIAYNKEWKDLKLPTDPTPPCGDKFMGWTTTNIGSTGLDVDDDASEIADLDLMTSGNKSEKTGATGHYITDATVTFYAVFADYVEPAD